MGALHNYRPIKYTPAIISNVQTVVLLTLVSKGFFRDGHVALVRRKSSTQWQMLRNDGNLSRYDWTFHRVPNYKRSAEIWSLGILFSMLAWIFLYPASHKKTVRASETLSTPYPTTGGFILAIALCAAFLVFGVHIDWHAFLTFLFSK